MPLRYILPISLTLCCAAGASGSAAATCELPEKRLAGAYAAEMSAAFEGFVMGQVTADAQRYDAEKLIDSYMRKADDADGIMEGVAFTLEGRVGAEKVDLGFLLRGDDDPGAMVTVLDLDLDGRVESGLMSGQFDGQPIDWTCALESLFDEDAPPKRCGTVPVSGTWAAHRQ